MLSRIGCALSKRLLQSAWAKRRGNYRRRLSSISSAAQRETLHARQYSCIRNISFAYALIVRSRYVFDAIVRNRRENGGIWTANEASRTVLDWGCPVDKHFPRTSRVWQGRWPALATAAGTGLLLAGVVIAMRIKPRGVEKSERAQRMGIGNLIFASPVTRRFVRIFGQMGTEVVILADVSVRETRDAQCEGSAIRPFNGSRLRIPHETQYQRSSRNTHSVISSVTPPLDIGSAVGSP